MKIVVDTNIIVKGSKIDNIYYTNLLGLILTREIVLLLDHKRCLEKEYIRNAKGLEYYEKWYHEMSKRRLFLWTNGVLCKKVSNRLRILGMHETEDHVVVALALNGDKVIITEDSDFGKGNTNRAAINKQVLNFLENDLNISVKDTNEAIVFLK